MTALAVLRAWWWPAFVLVYPLLAWPVQGPSRAGAAELHWWIAGVALLGGLLLELTAPRPAALGNLVTWARSRPAVLIALLFGAWCLLAAAFAPDQRAAYLGGAFDHADGALWVGAMVLLFVLVARAHTRDPDLSRRLTWALAVAVAVVSVGALVEVARGAGIFYKYIARDMPLVSFPQKGHLAGLLVMGAAAAAGLAGRARWLAVLPALALGLTVNRAGWLALAVVLVFLLWRERQRWPLALTLVVAVGAGYLLVNQQQGGNTKQATDEGSLTSRTYFWRSAARGILARPLTGWGGGQYYLHWGDYLTLPELKANIKLELNETLLSYTSGEKTPFHTRNAQGETLNRYYTAWKAHNELLEQGLMHGLVGLALYLTLLVLTLAQARRAPLGAFAAFLGYQVFLLLWFVIPESDGLLWSVWALSAGEAALRRAPTDHPVTQART